MEDTDWERRRHTEFELIPENEEPASGPNIVIEILVVMLIITIILIVQHMRHS